MLLVQPRLLSCRMESSAFPVPGLSASEDNVRLQRRESHKHWFYLVENSEIQKLRFYLVGNSDIHS